jgi:hypothetical protein
MRILLLATALCALMMANRPSHRSYSEVEGHVYQTYDAVGPVGPISGAKVSNNWDLTTATTDNSGYFHLRIRPGLADDEFITLIVRTGSTVVCHNGGRSVNIFLEGGLRRFANVRCRDNTSAK